MRVGFLPSLARGALAGAAFLWASGSGAAALAQDASPRRQIDDVITVQGKLSGPRLWRLSRGDAEVFILVAVDFVPDDLQWDEENIKSILEYTDEVLLMPTASLAPSNGARLVGTLLRTVVFNRGRLFMPRGETLADRVGPDLAAAFDRARARVDARARRTPDPTDAPEAPAPSGGEETEDWQNAEEAEARAAAFEEPGAEAIAERLARLEPKRLHPFFQAQDLSGDAIDSVGLKPFNVIERRIKKLARRVQSRPKPETRPIVEFQVAYQDVKQVIKSVRKFSKETDAICIGGAIVFSEETVLEQHDLARAWARGDVSYLYDHAELTPASDCERAISREIGGLKTFGGAALDELDFVQIWVDEIGEALSTPGTRFAIIPAGAWLRADGALDRLIAAGYDVNGPKLKRDPARGAERP